jgi:U3 small nucleolar RNA-associated protein 21
MILIHSLSIDEDDEESDDSESDAININDESATQEQLTDKMITLSLEPRSKWQNLLNLETIKVRRKDEEGITTKYSYIIGSFLNLAKE